MTAPAENDGRGELSPEERAAFKRRITDLEGKLGRLRGEAVAKEPGRGGGESVPSPEARGAALAQAMRIATELVVGVAVGGLIGWLLDRWLGTAPWLMIVFFVAGFAAGLLNVVRSAQRMQAKVLPGRDPADEDDDADR